MTESTVVVTDEFEEPRDVWLAIELTLESSIVTKPGGKRDEWIGWESEWVGDRVSEWVSTWVNEWVSVIHENHCQMRSMCWLTWASSSSVCKCMLWYIFLSARSLVQHRARSIQSLQLHERLFLDEVEKKHDKVREVKEYMTVQWSYSDGHRRIWYLEPCTSFFTSSDHRLDAAIHTAAADVYTN